MCGTEIIFLMMCTFDIYFAPWTDVEYCDLHVCVSVHISQKNTYWSWLGPSLMIVQYVMNIWFCG